MSSFRKSNYFLKKVLLLSEGARFSKWRRSSGYGQANFFSMGDKSKILFPSMGYSYPGYSKKQFLSSWGVPMGPWGPFGSFSGKNGYFWTYLQKNRNFLAF